MIKTICNKKTEAFIMAKMPLPANGLLINPDENSADAYEGYLCCPCGCETFRVRHNGRLVGALQRLWAANWFKPDGEALVIDACCTACGKAVTLHCSRQDERGWLLPVSPRMTEFHHPKLMDQRVRLHVIYNWDDDAEMEGSQYLTTYTLFSLGAQSSEQEDVLHVYEEPI